MKTIAELEDRLRHMGYSTGRNVLKEGQSLARSGFRYTIYTSEHEYRISAYEGTPEKPGGYLGCLVSCRKPRAGEAHTRGNDLPDGEFSEGTWNSILARIVSFELEALAPDCGPQALDPFPAPERPQGIPVDLTPATNTTQLTAIN